MACFSSMNMLFSGGISVFLAVCFILLSTVAAKQNNRNLYWANASFCDPCMGNKTVKMVGNSSYNQAVQEECRTITDLTEDYINAFTNDTVEIREILENERRNIERRHNHPYLIQMILPGLEDPNINPLLHELVATRNYLDEYTALVYRKFVMLASHVSIVAELGMIRSDIQAAYSKFGHALCKLKKFRTDLGLGMPLSDMCQHNGYVSLHSRARKIGYSIFVLKQGADLLTNILLEIREVVLRETIGCKIRCIPELPKTLECRKD